MDVKSAFLNGKLEEEIFMDQPEGHVVEGKECKAPKQWHEKFDKVLLSNGFLINDADKCLYCKSTEHYIEKILRKFGYYDCKPLSTPYDANTQLKKNKGESVSQSEYAQIIGSLMCLMNCTRPDIAYVVGRLSRYTQSPNKEHWTAISRVLKYLRGTMNFGLKYSGFLAVLEGYSDANWISDSDEMKSTSGYVFTIGGGVVSCKSSKQMCIARSTMESEFIALENAGTEAEWLRNLLVDIPLWKRPAPFCVYALHIHLKHNIVRQLLETGVISIEFVRSDMNLADSLTKSLWQKLVSNTSRGMGLMSISTVNSDGNLTYVKGDPNKLLGKAFAYIITSIC
ncbi:unnamed protein product [Prunus armeniaca]|uniref:Reverse transcriptase Ty1/copia-type domain-containing protein n=1 Tax=Prunus armeniaca TaxID=36596 RepID=A0A6J5TIB0_PRUAR|nr:unnamed protein product [Prunus armeniaca]